MQISRLGFGGAAIGNLYNAVSEEDAQAAIRTALEINVGLIDTAPYYGHGRSEARIGAALSTWGGPRPKISSKVGRVLDPVAPGEEGDFGFADPLPFRPRFDYSRSGVRRSLESSLERLGVARLDIVLVHDISPLVHGDAYAAMLKQVLDEALPELGKARREGLVGEIGIGVNEHQACLDVIGRAPLDCVLLAGRHSLFEQTAFAAGALDALAEAGVGVLAAGVFNSGLLAQRPSRTSTYNYTPAPREAVARAERIWSVCAAHGVAPQAAAMQFPLAHRAVRAIVVGARSAAEVEAQAQWLHAEIPAALWTDLIAQDLLDAAAPVPT